jgi:hypothetical protein
VNSNPWVGAIRPRVAPLFRSRVGDCDFIFSVNASTNFGEFKGWVMWNRGRAEDYRRDAEGAEGEEKKMAEEWIAVESENRGEGNFKFQI